MATAQNSYIEKQKAALGTWKASAIRKLSARRSPPSVSNRPSLP